MVPVNPGLFMKITGTGIIITKKGPGFAGTGISRSVSNKDPSNYEATLSLYHL